VTAAWRMRIFSLAAAAFACLYFLGVRNLPPWGQYRGPYGDVIDSLTVYQRHATDVVNAVDYDYRGFDTMGEEFILFTSVLGVMLLLRDPKGAPQTPSPESGLSETTRYSAAASFSLLVLFGLYMSTHGQLTPGGGFQGGVILATASMLIYTAEDFVIFRRITSHPLVEGLEALGAGAYGLIGIVSLFYSLPFLSNWMALGTTGEVFSSGTIAAISACVGLEVTGAFLLLGYTFLEEIISATGEGKR
jgi:multicomponent Na+:H+ antiporter subunit B